MKKLILTVLFTCSIFSLLSAEGLNKYEIKFIKGNISDKISSIKDADKETSERLAYWGVDFVLKNMNFIKDDRDLAGLAIASIMAYPKSQYSANAEDTCTKLGSIFYGFTDKNVRISVIDKLHSLEVSESHKETFAFILQYIQAAYDDNVVPAEVERKAIVVLGEIGRYEAFEDLYLIFKNKKWTSVEKELKNSLVSLAERSIRAIVDQINRSDYTELKLISSLFINNDKISATLKSEIAENLLNRSMLIVRDTGSVTKDISNFQLELCKILCENNWTRSSPLMISYFDVAKTQQKAGFITEEQFAEIIINIEKLSSKDSVKVFVSHLDSLNAEMNDGKTPSLTIVSALISALGDLGDKSAFDCLLYTTYLSYPEEIITQARSALSSLKW
ncbi:MAG: hypothetical protein KBS84_06940 [Treponema sp.]|nr:hypothetical protein [Candidatus Treponema scatequi]